MKIKLRSLLTPDIIVVSDFSKNQNFDTNKLK